MHLLDSVTNRYHSATRTGLRFAPAYRSDRAGSEHPNRAGNRALPPLQGGQPGSPVPAPGFGDQPGGRFSPVSPAQPGVSQETL